MLFRIYTENRNLEAIEGIIGERFQGFTITPAVGYWNGTREATIVVDILAPESDRVHVYSAAEAIKVRNAQEAVLVTETETSQTLI